MMDLLKTFEEDANKPICSLGFSQTAVLLKAGGILDGISFEEAKEILRSIDWLFMCWVHPEEMQEHEPVLEELSTYMKFRDRYEVPDPTLYSLTATLFLCRDDAITLEIIGQSNINWPIWFAVLAKAFCLCAIREQRRFVEEVRNGANDISEWNLRRIGDSMCNAVEAITYAERLMNADDSLREKVREFTKRAAVSRHAATNALKEEFSTYFGSKKFPSRAEAARKFYESLPADKKRLLKPTNAIRTLTESIKG